MATVDEILTRQAYADGDETWTVDGNYPSYHLYVEPEYVPVTNKRIADFNDQISVRGEQNAQFVGFQLPRYDDGLDLTAQHLYIHYQTVYGGSDSVPCNVSKSDSHVRMCWQVPAQATQEPGSIQMMIYATGTNSARERVTWKTLPASYTIHDGLEIGGGIPEPDQSWYEQFVQQMEGKVSTAQGHANDAQASKTAAAGSATASAESAAASAQALADNKAYVESQKETFVGYNKRETDLKYANVLIGSASGTTQVTVDDAWEAPIPVLEISGKSEQGADPSPDNPQEIVSTDVTAVTVTGANLFDTSALVNNNISCTVSSDRRQITVTGNKTNSLCGHIIPVQLIAGKTVTISGSISNGNQDVPVAIQIRTMQPDNKILYFNLFSSGSKKFSIPENIVDARLRVFANNSNTMLDTPNTVTYSDVMLNIGDTALPWEPYQSNAATIALTEPLRGIGDVRDRIMCRDGVWGVERKIVPLILNGSETWNQFNTSGSKSFGVADFDSPIKIGSAFLCDRLSEDKADNVWNGVRDNIIAYSYSSTKYLRIFLNSTATLDTLKALLSADPMHVIAERKSPTWEPLPSDTQAALNALTAYKGRTTITVTAEGPEPDVAVEYIADTKTYIANEHAKMQASFDRQISAILALLPAETQAAMINNETSALLAESEV